MKLKEVGVWLSGKTLALNTRDPELSPQYEGVVLQTESQMVSKLATTELATSQTELH